MRRHLLGALALGTLMACAIGFTGKAQGTQSGYSGTTIAVGRFGNIDASNLMLLPNPSGHPRHKDLWLSFQRTKGDSDVYVQNNVWQPGGTTGWHTHPGHSLIIVTAGTVTAYEGDDPKCRPHVYTVGMGFVDEGGDHVHVIRNEDGVEARTIAVQLIPAGATRKSDAEGNPACPF